MIWLEVRYTPQTVVSPERGVEYQLLVEVINASGIERDVFVHRTVDDRFMSAAMAYDMNTYPNSAAAALGAHAEFYRTSAVRVTFTASADAASARRSFKARLALLVRQWRDVQTEGLGDVEVEVYTAG